MQTPSQKGRVVAGGKRHALGGTFYEPTILTDVTPEMKLAGEESFGPVAPLVRFRTEEEAVQMANNTVRKRRATVTGSVAGNNHRSADPELAGTPSLQAKAPTEARTSPIITSGEAWWSPVVSVTVERKIPFQIADELDVTSVWRAPV